MIVALFLLDEDLSLLKSSFNTLKTSLDSNYSVLPNLATETYFFPLPRAGTHFTTDFAFFSALVSRSLPSDDAESADKATYLQLS